MTIQETMSAPIKLENARQIVKNENSYISRKVGDWVAILKPSMMTGFVVETRYKGEFLANRVFGQLESAVNDINRQVKDVLISRAEDQARRS